MPRLVTLNGIAIFVYADDHNPPYFHAISADEEVLLVIADLSIYAGTLRSVDLKLVRA